MSYLRKWVKDALAQVRELAADAEELAGASEGVLAEHLVTVLTARYAAALAWPWPGEPTAEFRRKLRSLRGLCQGIVELRRGNHSAARLKIEQERLTQDREKTQEELVVHFQRWARYPQVRDWICFDSPAPEQHAQRRREILSLSPAPAANTAPHSHAGTQGDIQNSKRIQPNQTPGVSYSSSKPLTATAPGWYS